VKRYGADPDTVEQLGSLFGISSICNILGAIKTAKYYRMGKDDLIVTVATDGLDRYGSVMEAMRRDYGVVDETEAIARVRSLFHGLRTDYIWEGNWENRARWHNLKYYTWVEQQGKTVQELDAQKDPAWWEAEQALVREIDARLLEYRRTGRI
ncbi:MAG: pyridoxal-5'-phosphate-dependent protein subunit beta, partial [Anaerolineae bacterium]